MVEPNPDSNLSTPSNISAVRVLGGSDLFSKDDSDYPEVVGAVRVLGSSDCFSKIDSDYSGVVGDDTKLSNCNTSELTRDDDITSVKHHNILTQSQTKSSSVDIGVNKGKAGGDENDSKIMVSTQDTKTSRDYYFDSYSHHGIHEEMLKDEVRTKTYQKAILENKHLFQDKIVLDVGCGTGILAMFAVQAGAKHVYAIDCSSIIEHARTIVEKNGFGEKITLIRGKVEEIELPIENDNQIVDIIISEWMGYFLLYESMLNTVIFARDKWLVPENGIIFPDKAVMYLCAIEDAQAKSERIDYWNDVYGFDFSSIRDSAIQEPVVDVIDENAVVSNAAPILDIDILTCKKEELSFCSTFKLCAKRNDYVHGFVAYFECAFTQTHKPIGFSTAPFCAYTHWKQTLFYLEDTLTICEGEYIEGVIDCSPNQSNERDLDITIQVMLNGSCCKTKSKMQYYLR